MSFTDQRDGRRRRKPEPDSSQPAASSPPRKKRAAGDVGNALRSAYQTVVEEDVPPEMLDLLGKLG